MKDSWSDCMFPLCFTAWWKKHCRQSRVRVENDITADTLLLKKGDPLDNIWSFKNEYCSGLFIHVPSAWAQLERANAIDPHTFKT